MVRVLQVILLSVLLPLSAYTITDSNPCDAEMSSGCCSETQEKAEDTEKSGCCAEEVPETCCSTECECHAVKAASQTVGLLRNTKSISGNIQKNQFFVVELLDYTRIAKEVTKPPPKTL